MLDIPLVIVNPLFIGAYNLRHIKFAESAFIAFVVFIVFFLVALLFLDE